MIDHASSCACVICRNVSKVSIHACELLADEWERWISSTDGEARKLRSGEVGAVGSPRFVALQAIQRAIEERA